MKKINISIEKDSQFEVGVFDEKIFDEYINSFLKEVEGVVPSGESLTLVLHKNISKVKKDFLNKKETVLEKRDSKDIEKLWEYWVDTHALSGMVFEFSKKTLDNKVFLKIELSLF